MNNSFVSKIWKIRSGQQTSVQRTIMLIFIVIQCFTLIALYTSFSAQNQVVEDYSQYIQINELISEISIKFPKSQHYFEQFIKFKEIEYLESYAKNTIMIESLLIELDEMNRFDNTINVFYRNIKNMFQNYKELCTIALNSVHDTSPDDYQLYSDIEVQMNYINSHMQQLTKYHIEGHNASYQESVRKYNTRKTNIYIFIIVSLATTAILTFSAMKKIINAIKALNIQAKMLSEKNWNIKDIERNQYLELDTLGVAFNNMKHEIIAYIEQQKQKAELSMKLKEEQLKAAENERLLKETQFQALQMQMNPHFLFNTLNTISRLALLEDVPDITKVTEELANILRYNLYYIDEKVSLTKELEVLQSYVNIQSLRFEDNIIFEFDICDPTDGVMIPPMILQPIVENAIIHGCREKEADGKIVVLVHELNQFIVIEISDNGVGFENGVKGNKISTGESIGLSNVNKRLEYVFGRNDLLEIHSEKNTGTIVTIKIPLEVDHVSNTDSR